MAKSKADKFQVYRYLRPYALFQQDDTLVLADDNLGGIAFFIEVNHKIGSLSWSEAICCDTDNFDRDKARKIAQERFSANLITSVKYDASESLLDNILLYYSELPNQKQITARERTTFERLKQYIDNNNVLIEATQEMSNSMTAQSTL
jgi:hypothetical protein